MSLLCAAIENLFQSNPVQGLAGIKLLLANGARGDEENDKGETPLSFTEDRLNALLAEADDPVNAPDATEIGYKLNYLSQVHAALRGV